MPFDPNQRSSIVTDALKRKFGAPKPLTHEEQVIGKAKELATHVAKNISVLLKALPNTQSYSEIGTSSLMADMFRTGLNEFDREELLHLCVVLHVSPMMEWVNEQVSMGLIGVDKDKPI